jgi:hypothetical protein
VWRVIVVWFVLWMWIMAAVPIAVTLWAAAAISSGGKD